MRTLFFTALMAIGGVLASGCSVGQGITGVSTLAVGSIITLLAVIAYIMVTRKITDWRNTLRVKMNDLDTMTVGRSVDSATQAAICCALAEPGDELKPCR